MKKDIFLRVSETVLIASMIVFCWIISVDSLKTRKQINNLQDQITELASKTDAGVNNLSKKTLDLMYNTTQTDAKLRMMQNDVASMTDAMEKQKENLEQEIEEVRETIPASTEITTDITSEAPEAEAEPYKVASISVTRKKDSIADLDDTKADNPTHVDDPNPVPTGPHLTKEGGVFTFEGHTETYYNLDMSVVVRVAQERGIPGEYHVRSDGAKMIGDYIMVAACYDVHPYGSLVNTSLGMGIVVDTGGFTAWNAQNIDVSCAW